MCTVCCVTDDCAMAEAIGASVYVVRGEYTNIKLTTPAVITLTQAFLETRK